MKIIIERQKLIETLQNATANVISRRPTLPILGFIKLIIHENTLTFTSSNLETTIVESVEAEIQKEKTEKPLANGYLLIAHDLLNIIKRLPDEVTHMYFLENNKYHIETSTGKFTFSYLEGKDYVLIPKMVKPEDLIFETTTLKHYLSNAIAFTAKDNFRPAMECINFQVDEKSLKLESADGTKAFKFKKDYDDERKFKAMIPKGLAKVYIKTFSNETTKISISKNMISFSSDNLLIIGRLSEGEFPNTTNLYEAPLPNKITVNREDLLDAINRLSAIHKKDNYLIRFNIGDNLRMTVIEDMGESSGVETLPIVWDGDKIEIGLSFQALTICLKSFSTEDVILKYNEKHSPVIISDESEKQYTLLAPIMITE